MARATPADVRKIMTFDPSIANLSPFIDAANQLVTAVCVNPTPPIPPVVVAYTEPILKTIETWLAAHFLAIRDPRYASETIGQASVSYQNRPGVNLSLTPYGQNVKVLDFNGNLAWIDNHISQGKRARAGITYLGYCKDNYLSFPWRFFAFFTPD